MYATASKSRGPTLPEPAKELAELYKERLQKEGLTISIEQTY